MSFLVKDDFITIITIPALDSLTGSNDTIIEIMITEVMREISSYLEARYNVDILFAVSDATLQMYCKDMVLYHLHSRHHARPMPAIRQQRYERALKWLREVQQQECNPFGYMGVGVQVTAVVKTGGNEKRSNHQL